MLAGQAFDWATSPAIKNTHLRKNKKQKIILFNTISILSLSVITMPWRPPCEDQKAHRQRWHPVAPTLEEPELQRRGKALNAGGRERLGRVWTTQSWALQAYGCRMLRRGTYPVVYGMFMPPRLMLSHPTINRVEKHSKDTPLQIIASLADSLAPSFNFFIM